ncbi:MAG: amino acid adenylation domain-containing protein [Actinomycetia bacterium]|nr:amino acid adenylation domain-containing protein [Actinomycetes bacterium]
MTYAGLQARAGAVAAWLVDAGVRRGDLVGIVAGAGFGHVTAALGIMMAGAAFVPLDASTPPERAAFILRDAGVTAVCLADAPLPCDADVPVLDVAALVAEAGAAARVDLPAPGAADLAYCIYTSGTTGVPKGVLLEHRGLVNLVRYYSGDLRITPADTILQFASPAFDASVWDMTMALSGGATLRMLPHDGAWDPDGLRDGLRSCTVATLPPALALATGPSGLRLLITAASAATPAVVECARECGRYVNGYGPTETTVAASSWGHTPGEPVPDVVPIGRPLPGVSVYVLDGLEPCPVGVPGELCVGGAGVARGYLNRPELTAERFIDNPYGEGRLYRTGDVARWLQDGNLEFLGRTDDQVKIRGYRIELGEIEATLAGLPGVREAAVVVRTAGDGEAALCGYVAAEGSDSDTLLAGLARHLPAYMVPDQLVVLGALPHNTSGKVDKAALPIVVAPNAGPHVAPAGAAELAVAACFEAILGARDGDDDAGVHADADFFALGGDSIKAIRMVSRLREAGYGTTVRDIITARTLRRIAAGLTGAPAAAASNEPVTGEVPLTPIQRAFFAAGHARPGHFNQAVFLRSSEPLDEAALGEALAALARHHDMLRACYPGGVQRVRAVDEGPLYALTSIDTRGRRVDPVQVGAFNDAIQASFDLETGPLLAACRHRTDDGDHLLLAIHHLVVDGVSWRILAEDLANAYAQARAGATPRLPDKTASFRDWALLLEEIVTSGAAAAEDDYWRTTAGQAQTHDLRPSRAPAPGAAGYARTAIRATADVTAGLLRGTGAYEVDQVLLAAFALAAGRWSGQAQVGFEVEGHGREPWTRTVAVDRTVGWFTSWYPVVLPTRGDAGDVLAATREVLHGVPHGGLGYGLLHGVGAPHPGWVFNYLGQADAEQTGPLTPSPWPAGATIAPENRLPNAVSMNGSIAGGVLTFDVTYDTALWHEADVQAFARAYETALTEVVAHCAAAPRLAAPGVSAAEADEIASLFE